MSNHRTIITLEEEVFSFLSAQAKNNKSAYINNLLKQEKQRMLCRQLFKDNQEEAEDVDYQQDLHIWDVTLQDGLDSDE